MPLIPVENADDPRLEPYRGLKGSDQSRRDRLFVVEGENLVRRLLRSDFAIRSVLTGVHRIDRLREALPDDVDVLTAKPEIVDRIIGYKFHSGVLACGVRKPNPELTDLIDALPSDRPAAACVCADVDNPDNLGAILRTCSALGIDFVLLGGGRPDPFSRRVLRVSMGEAFWLPIRETDDLQNDLSTLEDRDFELIATTLCHDATPLPEAKRRHRIAVLLGNEAHGLGRRWIDRCRRQVRIPMAGAVDSLNVALAGAICLYHFTCVAEFDSG